MRGSGRLSALFRSHVNELIPRAAAHGADGSDEPAR